MKKFTFSLQMLLEYRQRQETNAQSHLLQCQDRLHLALEKLNDLKQAYEACQYAIQNSQSHPELTYYYQILTKLKSQMEKHREVLDQLQKETERVRALLKNAIIQRKIIETLKDRQLTQWKSEFVRQEQIFLDEIATIRYTHSKKHKKMS